MTDLTTLISRLEAATGPDREIDARLSAALYDIPDPPKAFKLGVRAPANIHREDWLIECWGVAGLVRSYAPPRYTASLDAALSLVERVLPGWRWAASSNEDGSAFAYVFRKDLTREPGSQHVDFRANAPTPALALCLALLKAMKAQGA